MPTQAERLEAVKKRTREAAILFEHKDSKLVDIRDGERAVHVMPTALLRPAVNHHRAMFLRAQSRRLCAAWE